MLVGLTLQYSELQWHSVPGGGVLSYIRYIGVCRPKGYGFWAVLVWKQVLILNVLVWNWVWLSGGRSRKLINLFFFPASNWWERKRNRSNRSFQLNFTYSSLLRWIPFSTDAYGMLNHVQGQVWKRVWIFESRSENGFGKWRFFGLKLGLDLEMRAAHPHQKFQGVPTPPGLWPNVDQLYKTISFNKLVFSCINVIQNHG